MSDNHVLVIEDDPQVAEIIYVNLLAAGLRATVVPDGRTALLTFDDVRPNLVTIDLNLPEVSGFRLVSIFKRIAPRLPVIVVTGLEFEEAEEIARAGADDFLSKPFEPHVLVDRIRYHLAKLRSPLPWPPRFNDRLGKKPLRAGVA